jgi:hypothetical protein
MSSFLVSKETINNIVTGLTSKTWTDCIMWDYPFKDVINEDEDFNKLGKELIKLNLLALGKRYGDELNEEEINNYEFNFKDSSKIQFIKNLQCFLYQCSEGDIINTKLFKDLRKVEIALINDYINDLEEYKTAKWGF